jgi:hypothetical protein
LIISADGSGAVRVVRETGEEVKRLGASAANTNRSTAEATRGLERFGAAGQDARRQLEAMVDRTGRLSAVMGALSATALTVGAVVAGVFAAFAAGLREAAQEEQLMLRLDAVLRATGQAAGLTRAQIVGVIDEIKNTTLASEESVQRAASVLATFRSIQGETFGEALRLGADMAAVFGQDMTSAAVQLGKALEDPATGLTALQRIGVTFSDTQREMIAEMMRAGQQAQAQGVILDEVRRQIGGAGRAEAGGLIGAVDSVRKAWSDLLEELGKTPGVANAVRFALENIARGVRTTNEALGGGDIGGQIVGAQRARLDAERQLDTLRSRRFPGRDNAIAEQERVVRQLLDRENALVEQARREARERREAEAQAEQGRIAATEQRNRDQQLARIRDLTQQVIAADQDRGRQRLRIASATQEEIDRIEGRRGQPGVSDEGIAREIELARARERQQLNALDQAGGGRETDRVQRVIDDLTRAQATLADARARFVAQAVARAGEASEAELARIRELAGALHDEKEAQERANQAREEGRRIFEATRTPAEALASEFTRLAELHRQGALDADTYGRAVREAHDRASSGVEGLGKAFESMGKRSAKEIADLVVGLDRANFSIGRLLQTIASDLLSKFIQERITGPLFQAGGRILDSLLGAAFGGGAAPAFNPATFYGGTFHGGGVAGNDNVPWRQINPALFAHAPRLHGGLLPGEFPAILERGEGVFTPGQMAALGGASVQIIDQRGANAPPVEVSQSRGPDGRMLIRALIKAEVADAFDRGDLDRSLGANYGLARQPVRRS